MVEHSRSDITPTTSDESESDAEASVQAKDVPIDISLSEQKPEEAARKRSATTTSATDESGDGSNVEPPPQLNNCGEKWSKLIQKSHQPVIAGLQWIAQKSAHHPWIAIAIICAISLGLLIAGLFTNFSLDVNENILWTPFGSYPIQHTNWIQKDSGFPADQRMFFMFFHDNGESVLSKDRVRKVFKAFDVATKTVGYEEACQGDADTPITMTVNKNHTDRCLFSGITTFWNNSVDEFRRYKGDDEDVVRTLSSDHYPDGREVAELDIFGYPRRDDFGNLTSVLAYTVIILLPPSEATFQWETAVVQNVLALNDKWDDDFRVEVQSDSSFEEEFTRAVEEDIPLIPIVFCIMSAFTCAVFWKRNKVHSRSLLGLGAVVGVLLSIMTGYGLMFIVGTPFTSITQILPFVIFGIGLDDAFIIMGSYGRTDARMDPVDRIKIVVDEVGISITLTTITSATAFGLGCISTVPAVYWLCLYAVPTIVSVLFYQLTFFVACIVLDERRIMARRRDCCLCIKSNVLEEYVDTESRVDRMMEWYAERLLHPWVKGVVMVAAAMLFGLCTWRATMFEVAFELSDVLPSDSYLQTYLSSADLYTERINIMAGVYFRNVDQSDPEVQAQMEQYVNDLVNMSSVETQPERFWLRHFHEAVAAFPGAANYTFNEQIERFISEPIFNRVYGNDIVFDDEGNIVTSRLFIQLDNVDLNSVQNQIDTILDQRAVSQAQAINEGKKDFSFFTYDNLYNIWEFFSVIVDELVFTTIIGVVSVTGVSLLMIPHWSAAPIVLPMICILYIDLLGIMQWAGITINAVSYVALVMSIGLLVDFVLHCLLRFYESAGNRREKTIEMLRTIGASILVGGVSTFLGTLPLAFSTSDIFYTIFVAFIGLVTLGMGHGLIVLPVILSTFGPEDQILVAPINHTKKKVEVLPERKRVLVYI